MYDKKEDSHWKQQCVQVVHLLDKGISGAQCATCATLIAHVTAGLLYYKLVISF